jgi:hypothetical protein
VCVLQLLNPVLYDKNETVYGFNRSVIHPDDLRYGINSSGTNYTEEQVDVKFIIGT